MILEALQYGFIQKALLAGSLIALSCAFLGVFLVLRKFSMIGDGLAHVSFATVALALLLSMSPLLLSIPLVILSSFLILKLNEKANLHGDAAIGLVSSFSVAIGIVIASMAQGFNVDLFSYLFGSILVISSLDVYLSVALSLVVIGVIVFHYHDLFAITYDENYARVSGMKVEYLNYLIAVMTSITIVLGIRVVGTMLVSSLIVFPAVTALQVSKSFRGAMAIAATTSVICVIAGVFASYQLNLPTGGTIVIFNAICFVMAFGYKVLARA